jgi:hypothetical protein
MEKRPTWTPEWVWIEYLEWIEQFQPRTNIEPPFGLESVDDAALELAHTIVHEKECKIVWSAMERRAGLFEERWVENNIEMPRGTRIGLPKKLHALLISALGAVHGPLPGELIPAQERKKRGGRIARLAKELRIELKNCSTPGFGLPDEIERHVSTMAKRSSALQQRRAIQ